MKRMVWAGSAPDYRLLLKGAI